MASITGITFNFHKTITADGETPTSDKPADTTTPQAKISGEKSDGMGA